MLTLNEAAEFFYASAARVQPEGAELVATIVERGAVAARALIGREHDGWPALSTATVEGFRHINGRWIPGKQELGYGGAESPLLRRGDLRDSVSWVSEGLVGEVGSDSKIALWQELGTDHAEYPIPPRPFISRGLLDAAAASFEELAEVMVMSLLVPRA